MFYSGNYFNLTLTFRSIVHFESDMGVKFHYFASRFKFFNLICSIKNNEKNTIHYTLNYLGNFIKS